MNSRHNTNIKKLKEKVFKYFLKDAAVDWCQRLCG